MGGRFSRILLATTAWLTLGLQPLLGNPLGGQVVGGSASIQGQGTSQVTVTQSTNRAIINWNTFNISGGETTRFIQPNSSSVALNRVTGGLGPSQLYGTLTANGRIFLVNPDGILVGPGAKIDTAGFLATTSDIKNRDFMRGRFNFNIPGRPDASIVNLGSITASSQGFSALVAPGVRNSGTITAALGKISLASGNFFTLDLYGDSLIKLAVSDSIASQVKDAATGQRLNSLVSNTGTLSATGGRIELSAVTARQVVDSVINNRGVIEANSIGTQNGKIVLMTQTAATKLAGAPTQTVNVSGSLSTAGQNPGEKGGTIQITGENIVVANARLNASGDAGGGKVLVGGDWGGGHPTGYIINPSAKLEANLIPTATNVSVDAGTVIDASAIQTGDGGKVIVWADGTTNFNGTILARGGLLTGNGGFVETSGHVLNVRGARVNTLAINGRAGDWLLDPYDLTIDAAAAATISSNLATSNIVVQTMATSYSGPGNATIGSGDIIVASDISWNSGSSLTLSAYRTIAVNANITTTGVAEIILRADNTGTGVGTVTFGGSAQVSTPWQVTIFYNPSVNPAGSGVNPTSYVGPTESFSRGIAYMLVNTIYDLQNVQNNLGGLYALGKDIDASVTATWNSGAGFAPIGRSIANRFSAIFEGQGHTISNLTINRPTEDNVGLFGVAAYVRRVGVLNANITGRSNVGALAGVSIGDIWRSYTTGSVTGVSNVGGLTGYIFGSGIGQSYSTANVTGVEYVGGLAGLMERNSIFGSIWQSYATGTVSGDYAGGLVGASYGATITQSYATGNVIGRGVGPVGGLVGTNANGNIITQSFATGSVSNTGTGPVGGLVGTNESSILESYAGGAVTGSDSVGGLVGSNIGSIWRSYATSASSGNSNVGGLVGWNQAGSIGQSFATGAVTGNSKVGGLVGWMYAQFNNGGSVTESYATGAVSGASFVGGLVGSNNGLITQSYWDVQTSGQNSGIGDAGPLSGFSATGLTTIQARQQASYVGWDFNNTWFMINGQTRPVLRSGWSTTITNIDQLQLMWMNLSANYILGTNIDATVTATWDGGAGFVPVGTSAAPFTGTLDGQNHTISNLVIRHTPTSGTGIRTYAGLFGYVNAGTIENVGLVGGSTTGLNYVGALVGYNLSGNIINSYATGSVSGQLSVGGLVGENYGNTRIIRSHASGAVTGVGEVGGLVGLNTGGSNSGFGSITESYATGSVTGQYSVGGLVGAINGGNITRSYATGSVSAQHITNSYVGGQVSYTGGLVGYNYFTTITNSYATGAVSGVDQVGGLAGHNTGTITQSYSTGAATGWHQVGGLVGFNNNGSITQSYATGTLVITRGNSYQIGGLVGLNVGSITQSYATGLVTGIHDTNIVGGLVGLNSGSIVQSYATGAVSSSTGIGGLVGVNQGTITRSYATGQVNGDEDFGGLVGTNHGPISISYATGSVIGSRFLGGLIGSNYNSISESYATGEVFGSLWFGGLVGRNNGSILKSYSTGAVTGNFGYGHFAGGLVGLNYGTISQSYSTGAVTGAVSGSDWVGGLVGLNDQGQITNSYSTSSVRGNRYVGGLVGYQYLGSVSLSYAAGVVNGSISVGGLVGYGDHLLVTQSYWDTQTTGRNSGLGGTNGGTFSATGLITLQAQAQANYVGWNFANVWGINQSYPYLLWQFASVPQAPFGGQSGISDVRSQPGFHWRPDNYSQSSSTELSKWRWTPTPLTPGSQSDDQAVVVGGIAISPNDPIDHLTIPALESLLEPAFVSFEKYLPRDLRAEFKTEIGKRINNIIKNDRNLKVTPTVRILIAFAFDDVASIYVDKLTDRMVAKDGSIKGLLLASAANYFLKATANSIGVYIADPRLLRTGWVGARAAGIVGLSQATIQQVVDAIRARGEE